MLSVQLLGPVEVLRDGAPVDLGGPQQRAVLAHLALGAGQVVSAERLIDRLWGDEPPRTPLGTLQSYVSRLRGALEPPRAAGAPPRILVSEAPGYVLRVAREDIDVHCFEDLVGAGRRAAAGGRYREALGHLDTALALWRGPALGGVGPDERIRSIVVRLDEERAAALEDRFDVLLGLGRHHEVVPSLQAAVDEQPLRERLSALLALALYRSGRQVEALRTLTDARATLVDELGLDPGPELRALERRILDHDPSLLVHADAVTSLDAAPDLIDAPDNRPVGRAVEWAALQAALDAAATGRGHIALVEGEPGIGKTALCDAFLQRAAEVGWRTVTSRCVEPGLAPSLWPCIDVVRSMLATAERPSVSSTAMLESMVGSPGGAASLTPVQLADEFIALLDDLGRPPWVVLLDDLHWADQATLRLVALVLDRLGPRPLLVIGAHRPPALVPGSLLGATLGGLGGGSAVTKIQVSPLDADDVALLVERTTGTLPSHEVAARVHVRAGGNPLFVTELARLAGERGVTDDSEVPDAIRDVVRARLQQLPESCITELEVVAALGERFDLRTAMAASDRSPDECLDALDVAIVMRILVPDGPRLRFAHALVRDSVLAEISPLRKARLHHRAADALSATRGDDPDAAEPIAYHRHAAGAVSDPVVVARATLRAADVARWRGALDASDRLAQQALDVIEGAGATTVPADVQVEALESLISTARRRGDPTTIAAATDRIEALANRFGTDSAWALVVFLRWGRVDEVHDLDEIVPTIDRAMELASTTRDPYAIVSTRFILAAWNWLRGDVDAARRHADVAITASGAVDANARPAHVPLALLPQVASWISALHGDVVGAREHAYQRANAWMAQRNEVDPTGTIALDFYRALLEALLDEPARVVEQLDRLPDADAGGFVALETSASALLRAWADARSHVPGAVERALEAMARVENVGERILRSCLRTFVGDAQLAGGDERAVETLAAARREAEARKETFWLPETMRLQAEADRRFAGGGEAIGLLAAAEELASRQGAGLLVARAAASRSKLARSPA